nr:UDP-N-acetylmuramoyl-L-alanine--D-glutamate ligase [Lachnospiraceae bacterium]
KDEDANITLFDGNADINLEDIKKNIPEGTAIIVGSIPESIREATDLVIVSPGVPLDLDYVERFANDNIPIWGEIELGYMYSKGKIAAITGTNGKTTTTALVGAIMREYYNSVFVVGNIGIPYTNLVKETKEDSVTVAEVSSFQLETIRTFRPDVSAILNITPDHLNRHHTMENYIEAKENITMNQGKDDTCILNYEDEVLREFGKTLECKVAFFSSARKLENGIYLEGDNIIYNNNGEDTIVCNIHDLKLLGVHNYENVMAGILAGIALNVPMDVIRKAICEFTSVEHRIEYVATKNGVKYYNDSKGTNPDAAIKGIQAMVTKTLLIGGGYDKNSEYDEWINAFDGKVKKLILIGQTREKIADTCEKCGFKDYVFADSLEEAVNICKENACEGDAVLLSPACASWGMFKNYEERGRIFKELVNAL